VCHACFEDQVRVACERPPAELAQQQALVACCVCREEIGERAVAEHTRREAFEAYKRAQTAALTHLIQHRAEREMEGRLQNELARLARMSEEEREVLRHRNHLANEVLTLHCPREACHQAFVDFTGCFALTCSRCACGFCAMCLQDCGADAHAHVRGCVGEYFGSLEALNERWRARRTAQARAYLAAIRDEAMRGKVRAACARDFADLGVEL
jgi:hypothetical protein